MFDELVEAAPEVEVGLRACEFDSGRRALHRLHTAAMSGRATLYVVPEYGFRLTQLHSQAIRVPFVALPVHPGAAHVHREGGVVYAHGSTAKMQPRGITRASKCPAWPPRTRGSL